MIPFLPLYLRPNATSAPPPPPGAIVIDLMSEGEEDPPAAPAHPAPAAPAPPPQPPPLLPQDPTRRDGLFIAPSRVLVESGPSAGCGTAPLSTTRPGGAYWAAYNASHVFANWPSFVGRDDAARAFWAPHARVSVWDVSPLHARVDAHPAGGDCLHLCEPVLLGLLPGLLHHHLRTTPGLKMGDG